MEEQTFDGNPRSFQDAAAAVAGIGTVAMSAGERMSELVQLWEKIEDERKRKDDKYEQEIAEADIRARVRGTSEPKPAPFMNRAARRRAMKR